MPDTGSTGGNADIVSAIADLQASNTAEHEERLTVLKEIRDLLSGGGAPWPTKLLMEYSAKDDIDKDGKIFGHDFLFSDPPPMLEGIQNQLLEKNPIEQYQVITVAEYKAAQGI